ncbi:phosphatase PAP2 family protein [Lacihabitans sp. LS3-19]|uniref:phosphatase PAP2 family protein n=1 Tax=Lacihabitans sp. LS3-19 TaxID=2487335 RepID=UPI0020CD1F42|nr:phosphatase PAP2 family protein [Lacihabitans sp. LS3-19]
MIEQILEWDKNAFLWLNSYHNFWLDKTMLFFSASKVWIPLYVLIIFLFFKNFNWQNAIKFILIIIASVALSDFIASGIFKPYFQRLRPCHEILSEMILVGKCGGQFGFASSHAANSFALFMSIFLIFRRQNLWIFLLLFWAIIVSYSRIYLGVHYPIDILVGGCIGIVISLSIYKLFKLKTSL